MSGNRLLRPFFERPTPVVARELLGTVLVRRTEDGETLRGRIVETEAYHGTDDTASHASAGLTPRTAIMFGQAGHAYVYLIYGMYSLLNVTANEEGLPGAALIRAVEPLEGIDTMRGRRNGRLETLTNGPGRLTQAMTIDRALNGEDLVHSETLWIEMGAEVPDGRIGLATRIGISYAKQEHQDLLWRFFDQGSRWVSKKGGKP